MKLQAVSVCVNYADYFEHVAPENKALFDKWVVVTDKKDTEVTAICKEHALICVKTDIFYEKGIFNKYAGINEGLKLIDDDAWVLFLDSDMVLQPETRRVLEKINLNEDFLYGIDRINCHGHRRWLEYKAGTGVLAQNWMLSTVGYELGARLVHYYGHEGENGRFEGWRPLGFFQLAHRSAFVNYPDESLGADHCDLQFARLWRRKYRVFIPELLAVHLESIGAGKAINWYGRKSMHFQHETMEEPIVDQVQVDDQVTVGTIEVSKEIHYNKKNRWWIAMVLIICFLLSFRLLLYGCN